MNTIARLFLTFALGVATNLHAVIFESSFITDVTTHTDHNSLVIFDLDDTIFRTPSMLGNDAWFNYQVSQNMRRGLSCNDAVQHVLPLFIVIQLFTNLELIDPSINDVLDYCSQRSIPTMALSARSLGLVERTKQELKRLGIPFIKNAPHTHDIALGITHAARYSDGIIFGANNDKGQLLLQFLETSALHVKKIIFVDDKRSNLEAIERAVESHGMLFVGIRYSAEDVRKKQFDPVVAEKLLEEFKRKLAILPLG